MAAYLADGLAVGYLEPEGGTRWDAALAAATLRVEARPFPEEPIVQISISRSGPVAWESTLTARTVSESQVASCVLCASPSLHAKQLTKTSSVLQVWRANTCLFIIRPTDEQQVSTVQADGQLKSAHALMP